MIKKAMMEDFFSHFSWLETFGAIFGIIEVLLARKNNSNNYLFGIVSILLGMVVLYRSQLYGDILLNFYYLGMSIYGWLYWKYGKQHNETPISYATDWEHIKAGGIVIGCFVLMVYWLSNHTNSTVPYWDSIVCAFAWAGMWLMAKRKIENWIYLNISNIISIPLLFYKGLYVYAGLTIFLFVMGTSGFLKWRKIEKNEKRMRYPATPG